jgi:hypothetical protein
MIPYSATELRLTADDMATSHLETLELDMDLMKEGDKTLPAPIIFARGPPAAIKKILRVYSNVTFSVVIPHSYLTSHVMLNVRADPNYTNNRRS